jgi:hypothetical protein
MISSVTPPAEVYLQLNTDYSADDILCDSTSVLVESPRISSATGGIIEDPPCRQYFTGDIPLLVESPRIPSAQWSVFHWRYTSAGGVTEDIIRPVFSVSLEIYLCWWSHRGYHPPRCQCLTTPPAEVYPQ